MKVRLGTVFLPSFTPESLRGVARTAEWAGLDDLWVWEDLFRESGPATASAILAWTERVRVGVGLMPVPLRNVVVTAMEIATIDRLFPSRFVPAVGHGVQGWMARVGAKAESPMTLIAEYVDALQRLLRGETVTVDGRYVHLDAGRLDWPPINPPRLIVGGEGPKTLQFAGSHADGTMLTTALTEQRIHEMCNAVLAASAGREHEIVAHLMVARGVNAREQAATALEGWRGASADAVVIANSAADLAAAIDRLSDFGATTVLAHPLADETDPEGFVAWLGIDVAPLISSRREAR